MAVRQFFLGWDRPFLPQAVKWLAKQFERDNELDLSHVLIAVSGGRAGRRLLELLSENSSGRALNPPTIVTAGVLPELLYEAPIPSVDELTSLLVRVYVLRHADREKIARLVRLPEDDELQTWLELAVDLSQLQANLAAEGLQVSDVVDRCPNNETARWQALAWLQHQYEQALAAEGCRDLHAARFNAIHEAQCCTDWHIVLMATPELNRITRQILERVARRASVTALIHAPKDQAHLYDVMGTMIVDNWLKLRPPLEQSRICTVDRPRDQGHQVLHAIAETEGAYGADQITVGLGDPALGPVIERTLQLAGVPARSATGQRLLDTRPALLLSAVARYICTERLSDLATLVRHPDIETFLDFADGIDPERLSRLDRYTTEHLVGRLTGEWMGKDPSNLERMHAKLKNMLPKDPRRACPLPDWSEPLAEMLAAVYGRRPLNRHAPDDAGVIHVLEVISQCLRDQASLDRDHAFTPAATLSDAIMITLSQVAHETIPTEGGEPAVELLGWLELPLDDAPVLIISGFNEGKVPASRTSDAFLPDSLRRALGLPDNRRRFARDLMHLTSILHSRDQVILIAGRRGQEDEPLTPSRLLLSCAEEQIPPEVLHRIVVFYDDDTNRPNDFAPLLEHAPTSQFVIPPPERGDLRGEVEIPIAKLRVTAFRDYIICPYRFYLKYVLKLKGLDDRAVELDAAAFGELAHSVLDQFGKSDLKNSTDSNQIARFLSATLNDLIQARFGNEPLVAVIIQREQLRHRLLAFAQWQADQVSRGWRILHVEQDLEAKLEIDRGTPVCTITGRIDRIDEHPELGYRIIDYKTAESPKSPENAHRKRMHGRKRWIELQLPLYRTLAESIKITGDIELGYMQLPKDLAKTDFVPADWMLDELHSAREEARRIVREIRAGRFWPPKEPRFKDAFVAICMDRVMDRTAFLEAGDLAPGGDPR